MPDVKINNELTLTYPEGFQEMNEETLTRYFSSPKNRWGVYDPERHVIISVSWTKAGFFSFLTDAENVLLSAQARMRSNLINYKRTSSSKMKIAGKKGFGFRFEYRVNDRNIYQSGDLRAFKYKGKFYALEYIGRRITDEEHHPIFEEVMESVKVG